ncbi:MAG: hypothetical protein ACQEQM_00075 [Thermoplasmatota archaeon]
MFGILELGTLACAAILILVLIVIIISVFFKLILEFLPATAASVLVYLVTNSIIYSLAAFVIIALIMTFAERRKF